MTGYVPDPNKENTFSNYAYNIVEIKFRQHQCFIDKTSEKLPLAITKGHVIASVLDLNGFQSIFVSIPSQVQTR